MRGYPARSTSFGRLVSAKDDYIIVNINNSIDIMFFVIHDS